MDFANRTFGAVGGEAIITTSLFGYPEKMSVQAVEKRASGIERELLTLKRVDLPVPPQAGARSFAVLLFRFPPARRYSEDPDADHGLLPSSHCGSPNEAVDDRRAASWSVFLAYRVIAFDDQTIAQ